MLDGKLPILAAISTGCLYDVAVKALEEVFDCRDHVRKNDVSPGLHCRLVSAALLPAVAFVAVSLTVSLRSCQLDCKGVPPSFCPLHRYCLAQATVLSVFGTFQTEKRCKLGWTNSWMSTAQTKCLR